MSKRWQRHLAAWCFRRRIAHLLFFPSLRSVGGNASRVEVVVDDAEQRLPFFFPFSPAEKVIDKFHYTTFRRKGKSDA